MKVFETLQTNHHLPQPQPQSPITAHKINESGKTTNSTIPMAARPVRYAEDPFIDKWLRNIDSEALTRLPLQFLFQMEDNSDNTLGYGHRVSGMDNESISSDDSGYVIWLGSMQDEWFRAHEAVLIGDSATKKLDGSRQNINLLNKLGKWLGMLSTGARGQEASPEALTANDIVDIFRELLGWKRCREAQNKEGINDGEVVQVSVTACTAIFRASVRRMIGRLLTFMARKMDKDESLESIMDRIKLFVLEEAAEDNKSTDYSFTVDEIDAIRRSGKYAGKHVLALLHGFDELATMNSKLAPLRYQKGIKDQSEGTNHPNIRTSMVRMPYGHERVHTLHTQPRSAPGSPETLTKLQPNSTRRLVESTQPKTHACGTVEHDCQENPLVPPCTPRPQRAEPVTWEVSQTHRVLRNTSHDYLGQRILDFHAEKEKKKDASKKGGSAPKESTQPEFFVDYINTDAAGVEGWATSPEPSESEVSMIREKGSVNPALMPMMYDRMTASLLPSPEEQMKIFTRRHSEEVKSHGSDTPANSGDETEEDSDREEGGADIRAPGTSLTGMIPPDQRSDTTTDSRTFTYRGAMRSLHLLYPNGIPGVVQEELTRPREGITVPPQGKERVSDIVINQNVHQEGDHKPSEASVKSKANPAARASPKETTTPHPQPHKQQQTPQNEASNHPPSNPKTNPTTTNPTTTTAPATAASTNTRPLAPNRRQFLTRKTARYAAHLATTLASQAAAAEARAAASTSRLERMVLLYAGMRASYEAEARRAERLAGAESRVRRALAHEVAQGRWLREQLGRMQGVSAFATAAVGGGTCAEGGAVGGGGNGGLTGW